MTAPADRPRLSVVIPVLNDAGALDSLLSELEESASDAREVLVVDGGSTDGSARLAGRRGADVIESPPGRGRQLAAGTRAARGTWLWMLHADSRGIAGPLAFLLTLPVSGAPSAGDPVLPEGVAWGRFDIRFPGGGPALAVVGRAMNLRSRITGICTGDQGIFVHREALQAAGGMPEQPLMEDVELSRRLKRFARPLARREIVGSSPRRWQRRGVAVTVLSMWAFRLRYWLGADPVRLAREYYGRG